MAKKKTVKELKQDAKKSIPKDDLKYIKSNEPVLGRPPQYDAIINNSEEIYVLAARGFTDQEISDFFGIARSTFSEYKKEFPEFTALLNKAKIEADSMVIKRLYDRAIGYTTKETSIKEGVKGTELTETTKEIIPDVSAAKFWLSFRRGWKETTGIDLNDLEKKIEDMSPAEREQRLKELLNKANDITALGE